MKHFSRSLPEMSSPVVRRTSVAAVLAFTLISGTVEAQFVSLHQIGVLLSVHPQQGYLGIDMRDIDNERAAALKLKDATGVEITVVDHDAPAGKAGLRIHDVIEQVNGQPAGSCDQLRKVLKEIPPGGSVSFAVIRDGQSMNFNVQLVDRDTLAQDSWSNHTPVPDPDNDDPPEYPLVPPSGHKGTGTSGFFGVLNFGAPSIGVELDPLGSQLADYFGVKDGQGMLVKRVAQNSPASAAGFHAGDVVTKVNGQIIPTMNAWEKAMRANKGKVIPVTIMRNRREQVLNLQDGDAKHKG
jgi:serine protease Do